MSRQADYTQRIYSWQEGMIQISGRESLPHDEVEHLIIKSNIRYQVKPPAVRFLKKRGLYSHYLWIPHRISLQDHHRNPVITLHEAAHSIAVKRLLSFGHKKAFLGIFQSLLMHWNVFEKKHLKGSMSAYKLPWHPISPKYMNGYR